MRPLILLALAATATAATATAAAAAPPSRFDAIVFFAGKTEGTGRMRIMFGPTRAVHVVGNGQVIDGDTIVLDQTVERAGRKTETRQWRIRRTTPGHYTGTLSDARGTITGESTGGKLHLAYRAKSGVRIEQWLTLAPDGRSARNILTARKLGIVVARLDETICKRD